MPVRPETRAPTLSSGRTYAATVPGSARKAARCRGVTDEAAPHIAVDEGQQREHRGRQQSETQDRHAHSPA